MGSATAKALGLPEMLAKILSYLSPQELATKARLVNKTWQNTVHEFEQLQTALRDAVHNTDLDWEEDTRRLVLTCEVKREFEAGKPTDHSKNREFICYDAERYYGNRGDNGGHSFARAEGNIPKLDDTSNNEASGSNDFFRLEKIDRKTLFSRGTPPTKISVMLWASVYIQKGKGPVAVYARRFKFDLTWKAGLTREMVQYMEAELWEDVQAYHEVIQELAKQTGIMIVKGTVKGYRYLTWRELSDLDDWMEKLQVGKHGTLQV
jgi:hypothetical protein